MVYLKSSGITTDFQTLKGKRIGYVGEFGKIQIDELTKHYGMTPDDYTAVRCGMNVSKAIIEGTIDAGIGLENVQMVELEEWLVGQGRPRDDVQMLRIDELAELGCCCFCSILYIGRSAVSHWEPRIDLRQPTTSSSLPTGQLSPSSWPPPSGLPTICSPPPKRLTSSTLT